MGAADDQSARAGDHQLREYRRRRRAWLRARVPLAAQALAFALPIAAVLAWYGAVSTHQVLLAPVLAGVVLYAVGDTVLRAPERVVRHRRLGRDQLATSRTLGALDPAGFTILHHRVWLGDRAFGSYTVEHLVIGPTGVFMVETKSWGSRENPPRILGGRLWRGRADQAGALAAARAAAAGITGVLLRELPACEPSALAVLPVLAVQGGRVSGTPRTITGVVVAEVSQLVAVITRIPRGAEPLPSEVVEELAGAAARAFPRAGVVHGMGGAPTAETAG